MTRMRRSDSDVDSDPTSEVTARSQTSLWRRKHPKSEANNSAFEHH